MLPRLLPMLLPRLLPMLRSMLFPFHRELAYEVLWAVTHRRPGALQKHQRVALVRRRNVDVLMAHARARPGWPALRFTDRLERSLDRPPTVPLPHVNFDL